jgi:hypothetical protein
MTMQKKIVYHPPEYKMESEILNVSVLIWNTVYLLYNLIKITSFFDPLNHNNILYEVGGGGAWVA